MAPGSDELEREVEKWREFERERPARIDTQLPGQESVWDYPRPPRLERTDRRVRVELAGTVLAESVRAYRLIETASPPTYYLPPSDVRTEFLEPGPNATLCEWKGIAKYWSARVGGRQVRDAAWSYPEPYSGYERIRGYLAFYPGKMDACYVGGLRVIPQPGSYYGGWVTPDVVGPFKGEPGSEAW